MIQVIKTPTSKQFYDLVKSSTKELLFCVPFIKKDVISHILNNIKPDVVVGVITYSNIARFANGSLDLEAIKMLLDKGFRVLNYQNLHAKIYLFDNEKALITSANLSYSALHNNYEYGVLIDKDNKEVIDIIYSDFVQMMESELCGEITLSKLQDIEKNVEEYKDNCLIQIDEDEDEILSVSPMMGLTKHLSQWQKDVFDCIESMESKTFSLSDIYKYESTLQAKHPNNKHVKEKIRQILQQLRDLGYIKFTGPGQYKKLWFFIDKSEEINHQVQA